MQYDSQLFISEDPQMFESEVQSNEKQHTVLTYFLYFIVIVSVLLLVYPFTQLNSKKIISFDPVIGLFGFVLLYKGFFLKLMIEKYGWASTSGFVSLFIAVFSIYFKLLDIAGG